MECLEVLLNTKLKLSRGGGSGSSGGSGDDECISELIADIARHEAALDTADDTEDINMTRDISHLPPEAQSMIVSLRHKVIFTGNSGLAAKRTPIRRKMELKLYARTGIREK